MKKILIRTVTKKECPWLDHDFTQGTIVYDFHGATYGCIGPQGRAFSMDGETPFFELPADAVEEINESRKQKLNRLD